MHRRRSSLCRNAPEDASEERDQAVIELVRVTLSERPDVVQPEGERQRTRRGGGLEARALDVRRDVPYRAGSRRTVGRADNLHCCDIGVQANQPDLERTLEGLLAGVLEPDGDA